MKIIIGSRESKLAVIQSRMVMELIGKSHPEAELDLVTMKTTGDKILDRTLDQIGGKGLFVKELDQALRGKRADLTVHSLKDMPMQTPEDLPIYAFSKREDPRDALVLPDGVTELTPGKPIGCSSRRRILQLMEVFPEFEFKTVRGNVQTRLRKLDDGEFSAIILASAGLKRLGLEGRISRYITTEESIPAAGQGILAIQGRAEDVGTFKPMLDAVVDEEATFCALAERAFVRELDGGCTSPVAAYAVIENGMLTLNGFYVNEDETVKRKGVITGESVHCESLGVQLARRLRSGE